jgi:NMD protein affecting ribosome stability and mRNA decay
MFSQRDRAPKGYGTRIRDLRSVPGGRHESERQVAARLADMRIGDLVAYAGRQYVVCGLDPMGVPDRRVDLEDLETGDSIRTPISELPAARDSSS